VKRQFLKLELTPETAMMLYVQTMGASGRDDSPQARLNLLADHLRQKSAFQLEHGSESKKQAKIALDACRVLTPGVKWELISWTTGEGGYRFYSPRRTDGKTSLGNRFARTTRVEREK